METATRLRQCPNCFGEYNESLDACPFCGYTPISQNDQYPLALAPGRILAGRYILGRVLGQGGFGITYLAWDVRDKVRVAIKEFFPDSLVMRQPDTTQVALLTADRQENFRFGKEQFLTEAKTLAQFVDNPNIVGVYSYFEENGTAYFAMEYVEGKSLKAYLKEKGGRLSWDETLQLLTPVMDALQAVHAKGIIHRDIKPDNIFITEDGHTKLLDFGSARYSLGDRSRSLDVVLTAGYAPKEQYARHSRQGPYTDVYSLAACFYACITGVVPTESVERTEDDDLPLPSARGAKLPAYAEDAILKGLSIKAENRWQTMADFKANLLSATPKKEDSTVVEDNPTDIHKTVNGNNNDDNKNENVVLDQEGSVTQSNGIVTTDKSRFINSIKKLNRPQIAGIIAAVLVICVFAGYMIIPFKATEKSIQIDGKEVGLYTGTVVAGKPSGEGRMEYTDGGVYDGSWKKGQRSGQGSMAYSNKNMYTGYWMADVENGEGTMNYASGDVYKGDWLDGERSGEGHMEYANGDVYEGGWLDDQRSGKGVLSTADGIRVYTGEWVEDEMNGAIVLTLSFNQEQGWVSTLEATYENGKLVGEGVYTPVNGGAITATWEYVESMTMVDGALYTGLLVDGVPYGYGSIVYEDETSYTGEFSKGKRSGVGLLDEGDDYYVGEWKDDARNGYGYYHYFDGSVFEGNWTSNTPNGWGRYTYVNGDVAEGEWSYADDEEIRLLETENYYLDSPYVGLLMDGVPCGYGVIIFELIGSEDRLSLYYGEWKDGHPQGDGIFLFENGDQLSGEWSFEQTDEHCAFVLNGKANGIGVRETNGELYYGEYKDGARSGYGMYVNGNDDRYFGTWENDKRNGQGEIYYTSGDVYKGEFIDDQRTGQGTYSWTSGNRYEGDFVNGMLNGQGTFYWTSGSYYEGEFKDGDVHGQGIYHWPNGDWFEGEWIDGQRNGQGTYHWADGGIRTGTWKNDKYVG